MFFYHSLAARAVYTTKTVFTVSTNMPDYQWMFDASEHNLVTALPVLGDGSQIGVLLDLSRFLFMKIDRRKWV